MIRDCLLTRWLGKCLVALVLAAGAMAADAAAEECGYPPGREDLFYNFYVGSGAHGAAPAQLYLSPRPTPPLVGHTYVTYQPLMPHEFLYRHQRHYSRYHPHGGLTRTKIHYTGAIGAAALYPWFGL